MSQAVDDSHKGAPLVSRLKLALTAEGELLTQVMEDHSAEVLHAALRNSALTEGHLLHLLQRQDLTTDLLRTISQHKLSQNHHVTLTLVRHAAMPPALTKQLLQRLHLFELLNLCVLPGQSTDIKVAAENGIVQRLAQEPLGNKITLARRAHSTLLSSLIREGNSQILEASLDNPRLKEAALFQFISSGKSSPQTISAVARHPRWSTRKNLQRAILKNQHTPQVWFITFLPNLSVMEVRNLLFAPRLKQCQKSWVQEHLNKRCHL